MNKITTLGIDLAKNVFQLHGVDDEGRVVLRRQVRRGQLSRTVAQLPECLIGMEACASAQHWARVFGSLGHEVRLMAPQYVKPYVKSQKNDDRDAEAICEAVRRPTMRFVPVKSLEQQDMQTAHRVREGLMRERTVLINRIRGLVGEYGITIRQQARSLRREVPEILEDAENGLTHVARQLVAGLYEQLRTQERHIEETEQLIQDLGKQHEVVRRLETVPGIAWLTATALFAAIGDARTFKNGRQLAAWLGLVPRQHSSGGKQRLLGITKRGDRYLRKLLIHGARSIAMWAERRPKPQDRWLNELRARRGKPRSYVAQANKTARIAWAVMTRGETYRAMAAVA